MSKSEECSLCGYATDRLTKTARNGKPVQFYREQWLCTYCQGTCVFTRFPGGEYGWTHEDRASKTICYCANVLQDALKRKRA